MLSLSVSNLVITIINILVLYLLLRKFLYKPVMGIIEKRDEMIKTQLETAKKTEQDAMQLKAQYENSLNDAHDESLRIVENSKARAQEEYSRIVKEADEQAGKIIDNARKTVELDREKAVRGHGKRSCQSCTCGSFKNAWRAEKCGGKSGTIRTIFIPGR